MLFYKKQKSQLKDRPLKYYPLVVTVGKAADTQEVARWITRKRLRQSRRSSRPECIKGKVQGTILQEVFIQT